LVTELKPPDRVQEQIMTNQLQGEILFAGWSGTTDADWAYTPWMPVRGDLATYGVEVLHLEGGATLIWGVQTRILESGTGPLDSPVSATTNPPITSPGVHAVVPVVPGAVPAKQLIRYRFRVTGSASVSAYAIFRALQPSWQVNR
jgi:hypothetical protein